MAVPLQNEGIQCHVWSLIKESCMKVCPDGQQSLIVTAVQGE